MSIAITEQPNYAAYSIEQAEDVLENIDKALPYTFHLASDKQETERNLLMQKAAALNTVDTHCC